jgi:hypothetical protein
MMAIFKKICILNFLYTLPITLYDGSGVEKHSYYIKRRLSSMDNSKKQLILSKKVDGP